MCDAVDVRIGHDDDAMVAQLGELEVVADAGAERGDQRADLVGAQDLVEARPLDVQDLAAQRQDRLEPPVAALLGRAAGGIALDQEQLGVRRIALLAVGELAGQVGDIEHALAPGQLARLARRLARRRRIDHLGDDRLGRRRVLLEPAIQALADHALHHLVDLGADQLVLGLRGELGVGHLDREHAGQTLARILAGQRQLLAFGDAALLSVGLNAPRERGAQAGEMGAAVALRDVVGEAQGALVVAVVPLQRGLDHDLVALALDQDRRLVQGGLGPVEIAHERDEAAVVVEQLLDRLGAALVAQQDGHAGVQERQLAQPMLERLVAELGLREHLDRWHEREFGAAPAVRRADYGKRRLGLAAVLEADQVLVLVAPDAQLEPLRERIDHRHADAVEPAGHLVRALVELAAGVQPGHDHLGGGHAFAFVDVGRDAAAVVAHGDRAVGVEDHIDPVAIAGERLVDGVVDDLEHHVMQTRTVVGVADVHAGAPAHRFQALEDLDRGRVVHAAREAARAWPN